MVELAFSHVGLDITWEGEGVDEVGKDKDGRVLVKIDPQYFRPTEVSLDAHRSLSMLLISLFNSLALSLTHTLNTPTPTTFP